MSYNYLDDLFIEEAAPALQRHSGGAELNIAYGDTEPDDTSKLWIKANEPESIAIAKDFDGFEGVGKIEALDIVMPSTHSGIGCVQVGTKVYLFGGGSGNNTIEVFDIETKAITTLETALPSSCTEMGCASVGTKIYLFGGINGSTTLDTINVFDTETETITTLNTTISIGHGMGCASVGTKIYLFGGRYYSSKWRFRSQIYMFDIETETIDQIALLPTACYRAGCISIGTNVYIFGGSGSTTLNTINVLNTETKTVTTLDTVLPFYRSGLCCENIGSKIYLFGDGGDAICIFDTEVQTITTLEFIVPMTIAGCARDGIEIYLFGSNSEDKINKFTLTHDLAQNNIEIITAHQNFFNVVNTDTMKVEIGVDSVLIGNAENQAENCEAYLYQNDSWVRV